MQGLGSDARTGPLHRTRAGAAPPQSRSTPADGHTPSQQSARPSFSDWLAAHRPREATMSVTDELLENNKSYAAAFDGPLPLPPSKQGAVVACMDARLDVYRILGLEEGEAHVIRNAGGVVTDDEIRSLAISQRLLGTQEVVLIHHTDCGMLTFTD